MSIKLFRSNPDLFVLKTLGTLAGTFTVTSGSVELDLGDGSSLTSNTPNHDYLTPAPFLVNILSDRTLVTGLNFASNNLTSFSVTGLVNLVTIDVSVNSIGSSDLDEMLVDLDTFGQTGGTLDVSSNSFNRGLSVEGALSRDNLIAKGWSITGLPIAWTPASLTTTAWYDADDAATITESVGKVSQWDDKSGNLNHLTQNIGSDQPGTGTRSINGVNALDFDGSNDRMLVTSTIDLIGKNVYAIISIDSYGGQILGGGTGNTQINLGTASQGMRAWKGTSNPYNGDTKGNVINPLGEAGLYGWLTDTDSKKYNTNGTIQITDGYTSGTFDVTAMGEGSFSSNSDVAIGELLIVPTMSQSDREKVEGYLAHKWGTQGKLPASHPYKASAPVA